MTNELPKIFSDEEIDQALQKRGERPRGDHERWDNAGTRTPARPSDGMPESWIEQQFPHIADKLQVVWPSEACALYISNLVVNRRDVRSGFPPEVLEDLLMLHEINDMLLRAGRPQPSAPPPFTAGRERR